MANKLLIDSISNATEFTHATIVRQYIWCIRSRTKVNICNEDVLAVVH
jgi:hypothetical protein